ncbi:VOC family protein [Streptomyces sp. AM 4-1-1]|uniref:VOC family protein n=1 Tax=Streptomyces sp. AM 4-1-1 TaxID=3028710 RepID=UPI0023B9997F|nr:VOC family protein [Streptomyces sp. AM 4-1-1]WEH37161.1 VOC family protein [Streptomyces sp. AM 4-1-1]
MTGRTYPAPSTTADPTTFGAPCWASLMTGDLARAQDFYGAVLGWEFRPTELGEEFSVAVSDGVPTAALGSLTPALRVPADWTPYFAVTDADEAAARIRERSGTVAVGPLELPVGRGALAADREGGRFGIWEGRLVEDWRTWRAHRPWWLDLRAVDAFDSAIFYGGVLDWACGRPGCCDVGYEGDEVVLWDDGRMAARITSAATPEAGGGGGNPRWNLHFPVPDVGSAVAAAVRRGGSVVGEPGPPDGGGTVLSDPDGARFVVVRAEGGHGRRTN